MPAAEHYSFVEKAPAPAAGARESLARTATPIAKDAPVNNAGAFTYSIPIDLPPGRAGMTPALEISYSSSAFRSEGDVAAGWTLALPKIARSVREGSPPLRSEAGVRYYADDAGQFEGASGQLVLAPDGPSGVQGTLYMPMREQTPVRYEFIGYQYSQGTPIQPAGGERWIEYLPSGTKRYYGQVPGRVGKIRNKLGTFAWLLLEEEDASGNHISYDYGYQVGLPDAYDCRPNPTIRRISWGGNKTTGRAHIFKAEFEVERSRYRREMSSLC